MKQIPYLVAISLLCSTVGFTQQKDTASGDAVKKLKYSWGVDILGFGRKFDFQTKPGTLNPNNAVAELDDWDAFLYIRPTIDVSYKNLELSIQPRFNFDYDKKHDKIGDDIYFQKLMAKYKIGSRVSVKAGRYFRPMGNGLFINPSNAFFHDPQRINPKLEPRPKDFAEIAYSTPNNWTISLIANLFKGEDKQYKEPFFEFSRRYGLQVEKYGASSQIGGLLSTDENGKMALGVYGQKNINDAFVVWLDLGLEKNIDRFYPQAGHETELINYDMVNDDLENDQTFFSGLGGISYTLEGGATFYLEYYYNGRAYTKEQWMFYDDMVKTAGEYTFDITKELSKRNLGRAINDGNVYNRRHYLFTQFIKNDIWDKVNVAARYFYGMDDNSHQFSGIIEYNMLDNLEFFTTGLVNVGKSTSEFRKLVNHQVNLGLIFKL